jgi:hypothetical protein
MSALTAALAGYRASRGEEPAGVLVSPDVLEEFAASVGLTSIVDEPSESVGGVQIFTDASLPAGTIRVLNPGEAGQFTKKQLVLS